MVVRMQSDNFNTADVSEMSLDRVRWMHLQIIQCHHLDDDNRYVDKSLADDDILTANNLDENGPSLIPEV